MVCAASVGQLSSSAPGKDAKAACVLLHAIGPAEISSSACNLLLAVHCTNSVRSLVQDHSVVLSYHHSLSLSESFFMVSQKLSSALRVAIAPLPFGAHGELSISPNIRACGDRRYEGGFCR
ncbi:hypothetical protein GUJ93_ZPchr0004g38653 [Zizania palustris]|uniref:Uncharacterized protein n=1 Tax=Zizania palustris TaxID=103762 RepID=A0A8J5S089_ZIZPA|nr:hypothetical protein GUJ93_ZPchr0004g38653 [Zizania palustris]